MATAPAKTPRKVWLIDMALLPTEPPGLRLDRLRLLLPVLHRHCGC